MTRNDAREKMMQILYELEVNRFLGNGSYTKDEAIAKAIELVKERLSGGHIERGEKILEKTISSLDEIDKSINQHSPKWKTSRMPKIDLSVLRLALGEIRYAEDIPEAVSVNEAINIARKFSTENSAKFIHGVLGSITGSKKDEQ